MKNKEKINILLQLGKLVNSNRENKYPEVDYEKNFLREKKKCFYTYY
jgi:hypothetical protein